MVGEIRDVETAQIAIQASLTGHLVMSTLHTNSASAAVARLLDMGLEPFLLATSLAGILAQRLVRQLCPNCKQPHTMSPEEHAATAEAFPDTEVPANVYQHGSCVYCNELGYRGRMGIFEYIDVDPTVQSMIIRRISGKELERHLQEKGSFSSLRHNGIEKVARGVTTLEEVLRVTTL